MAKTAISIPKVNRAILTIFVFSLTMQTSRLFDSHFESISCSSGNSTNMPACLQKVSSWVVRPDIYFPLYFGFRILFVNLGPCIALVILNVLLFRALKVSLFGRCSTGFLVNYSK